MQHQYGIPLAIVLGGILIAVAVYVNGGITKSTAITSTAEREENSHVYGDPRAEMTIVEFSDIECPFCARLHPSLKRIVDESDGRIKWEYRHLPLANHRNAVPAAYAAECVARLKGNEAFWNFLDHAFQNQQTLSEDFYQAYAEEIGISKEAFVSCTADSEIHEIVSEDRRAAAYLGGSGTPFSVVIFPDGRMRPVTGALPFPEWQVLTAQ